MSHNSQHVTIQQATFDVARETTLLLAGNRAVGAVVTFIGLVRDVNEGAAINGLYLEHYPGMAEKEIGRIIEEARQRWGLEAVRVTHRVGNLKPLDPIVFVGVASQHRADAFRACEFIMDYLKIRAPFWKKEQGKKESGELNSKWLDARQSDREKQAAWE